MAHFHSFSSFIESCVTMEDGTKSKSGSTKQSTPLAGSPRPHDCSLQAFLEPARLPIATAGSPQHKGKGALLLHHSPQEFSASAPYDCTAQPKRGLGAKDPLLAKLSGGSPETYRVDTILLKMEQLRSKPEADSEELEAMFIKVERTSAEIGRLDETDGQQPRTTEFRKFLTNPEFKYVDFAQRENKLNFPTFRIQDYNWDEEGFSLISRFYDDIAQLLDDKFKTAYNLTYGTMGRLSAVDTSMFRRATWNYIQCLYGVRWDDYDYSEVNDLLHRSLKKYIKTAACYPDRCTIEEYQDIMTDFQPSEKIHVCLLVAEAKFQSELLYALRAVATHFRS